MVIKHLKLQATTYWMASLYDFFIWHIQLIVNNQEITLIFSKEQSF